MFDTVELHEFFTYFLYLPFMNGWFANMFSQYFSLPVHLLSRVLLFVTPWTATRQASLSITNSQSLLKLMSIKLVMPSSHLILCRPLFLPASVFPSIRVFSNESILHIRWPKYWTFSFNISPSNEYSGLIFFRINWFDLLAVQGTLKGLQQHSQKASVLRGSAFFIVQPSHPHMTTGCRFFLIVLIVSFTCVEALNFDVVLLLIFAFIVLLLLHPKKCQERYQGTFMFYSGDFIVSGLIFKYLIH